MLSISEQRTAEAKKLREIFKAYCEQQKICRRLHLTTQIYQSFQSDDPYLNIGYSYEEQY